MNTQHNYRNGNERGRGWEELIDERMLEDNATHSICILASHEYEENGPSRG